LDLKAPGLKTRPNKSGPPSYYWVAANVTKKAKGFPMPTQRLHGTPEEILFRCGQLTAELYEWMNGQEAKPEYDGSLKSLIEFYRFTEESPYHAIKHNTRAMYDESLDLLIKTVGGRKLASLSGLDFNRWYAKLKEPAEHTEKELAAAKEAGIKPEPKPERMRRAYKAVQVLRIVVKFGVVANLSDCVRLATILQNMRFASPPARTQQITFEQVQAICTEALKQGRVSIAIAQALQFELTLRQVDVIGLWEPLAKGDEGKGIISARRRWTGGLLWSHIDSKGVLKKITTKTGQIAEHDTTAYPFLRTLLDAVPMEKRIGPIIIDEQSGLPYRDRQRYAKVWRKIAESCGVPKEVWNRDSRAGGVTEGSDAGANIEHLRHHANHSNIATTGKYNRNTLEKTRRVAELRVAHRTTAEHDKN